MTVGGKKMTNPIRLLAGAAFLLATLAAGHAGAATLKVLSVEAMKPALQQLVKDFRKESKNKVKVQYASEATIEKKVTAEEDYDVVILDKKAANKFRVAAKVAGGSIKDLAKKDSDVYTAAMINWTMQPRPAMKLIDFLHTPEAAKVYKAKGLQPG